MISLAYEQILVFGNMRAAVFYSTIEWKRVRYNALLTYGNRCQLCGAGPATGPLHVDHILPRAMYPERCLDPTNLQVLCNDCHTAKGVIYQDDCRSKRTQRVAELRDFFRIERRCLLLEHRPPTSLEIPVIGAAVRTANKKHRQRWSLFVKFCVVSKKVYREAARTTVDEFLQTEMVKNHQYQKFLQWGGNGAKSPNDLFFDIAGCPLPTSLGYLLADDQHEGRA